MKKIICAIIFLAMIYGANLFASDYDDCTFTPDDTSWPFPEEPSVSTYSASNVTNMHG